MSILDKINDLSVSAEDATTFPILYKYTNVVGQVQQWQIFVDGDTFYTEEGVVGGVITRSKPTKCTPKNVGKLNATTPAQQAIAEARAKHQKKLDNHYNEVLTEERSFYEPMLAKKYEDHRELLFSVPTFISVKIDGMRSIHYNNHHQSRGGKPILTVPHLCVGNIVLDGELYNHRYKYEFNGLMSLLKKQKPSDADLVKSAKDAEYWVYDFPNHPGVFSERYAALANWITNVNTNPSIKLVEAIQIYNYDELDVIHSQNLLDGWEGSIIRLDLGGYEGKRTKQLLKYKSWCDDEFEVVDIVEGQGNKSGLTGYVTLKLPDGRTFNSNMKGTFEYSKSVLDNKHLYIGGMATVVYQNLSEYGIPRIPYIKELNRTDL
jgi:DNA ligase 1